MWATRMKYGKTVYIHFGHNCRTTLDWATFVQQGTTTPILFDTCWNLTEISGRTHGPNRCTYIQIFSEQKHYTTSSNKKALNRPDTPWMSSDHISPMSLRAGRGIGLPFC